ncbi:hypothetical protein [Streptomyces prasinopilosus]|uniref:Uncharacterized protein n=1 Tax=Streptomyces prasinopilosus TaxID=67344 RepID=A0A1G6QMM8_9ACTN|nr:hypothetical protein [Streptomyces prasinopilosus]SDC92986.1 hypothetical protein SAMN05216505_104166 [Streptomyces prasinopilosus]
MNQDRSAPLMRGVPDPPDQDRRAWVAPTIATALLTVLGPVALLAAAMSPMATDACGPDDCSQALTTALDVVAWGTVLGGVLTLCAWLTSWLLPWRTRWSVPRAWAAALSLLPPLFVVLLVFNLPEG